jgi:hypothetical protein
MSLEAVAENRFERPAMSSPRTAGFAGVIFSALVLISLVTIELALPEKPGDSTELLTSSPNREILLVALSLIPFAAVAFLWFIGVMRERIGDREDKFFATVFLGSGLLFIAVLLVAEALTAAMVASLDPGARTETARTPVWWEATRNLSDQLLQAALQMAGVFTTATSALLLRTRALPRWLGTSGRVLSVVLFVAVFFTKWVGLLFPIWVFALSLSILLASRPDRWEPPDRTLT